MHICYISSYYDAELFENTQRHSISLNNAIQKFNGLILKGLSSNTEIKLSAISTLERGIKPATSRVDEKIGNNEINIFYAWNWNIRGLRNLGILISTFFRIMKMPKGTIVLSDVLKVSGTMGGLLAAKIRGFKTIGIVTDLPEYQGVSSNSYMLRLNNWAIHRQDGYVFLTEAMNFKLNKQNKPYVVVEGFSDEKMSLFSHKEWNPERKIVIYAGSLCAKYGICDLIDAFLSVRKDNEQLWIYGDGDYASEVERISTENDEIVYWGRQPNDVVVTAEMEATLLVNPRRPEGEYTKYSFPSKTLEYMSTGTPVLMYKLPGIPEEYSHYLYYIAGKDTISDDLRLTLDKTIDELAGQGAAAKEYVLSKKSSTVQAKKILELIRRMNNDVC